MKKIKAVLQKALWESGKILSDAMRKPKKIRYKGRGNLVTETDRFAEAKIVQIIKKHFPDHAILAEESASMVPVPKKTCPSDRPYAVPRLLRENRCQWIIDPIDGTTNFAHGLPMASVSIGFEDRGTITMGGVWNPFLKEFFWAEKGKGAFLNGKRIFVSKTPKLAGSLLVTGFPYDRITQARHYLKIVEAFLTTGHGIRRLGSASLDLCYVACGRFDGYWESKLMPWDQAAGYLIAKEAGAQITNFRGKSFSIYDKQILATNGKIHGEMLKVFSKFV